LTNDSEKGKKNNNRKKKRVRFFLWKKGPSGTLPGGGEVPLGQEKRRHSKGRKLGVAGSWTQKKKGPARRKENETWKGRKKHKNSR